MGNATGNAVENLVGSVQEMLWEMGLEIIRDRIEGKNLFNKVVIGENLAFGK